jgi:sigma-E factor negative regulatory protein RseB
MLAMPALRRPGLLISAVVAITVPGVLAIVALVGPDHTATRATAFAGAGAGEAVTGSGELYDYAETAQDGMGIQLLGESAAAGLAVSYQGVELLAQSGVTGEDTIVSDVWHSGGVTVTQTSDAAMLTGTPYVSYDMDNRSPEGVFGVTKTLVSLLGQHYVAVYQGTGSAVGRPALIVELHRADGSLAARFWLDRQTMVPLRREVFDTSARLTSEEAFVQVQFGALTKPPEPTATSSSGAEASAKASAGATAATPSGSGWSAVTAPAQLLAGLNKQGWRLPVSLPGGLPLYSAARSTTAAGQVLDLGYSDGLSVVSLFVQRGTLAQRPAGWQQVSLPGHQVYVAGHSIIWAGGGFVYTMLADAPPLVVTQVVASLPQNTAPGFFNRIMRGFHRLAAAADPFH